MDLERPSSALSIPELSVSNLPRSPQAFVGLYEGMSSGQSPMKRTQVLESLLRLHDSSRIPTPSTPQRRSSNLTLTSHMPLPRLAGNAVAPSRLRSALPAPITCLTWNADHFWAVDGSRRSDKLDILCQMLINHKPNVVFMQEAATLGAAFTDVMTRSGYSVFSSVGAPRLNT